MKMLSKIGCSAVVFAACFWAISASASDQQDVVASPEDEDALVQSLFSSSAKDLAVYKSENDGNGSNKGTVDSYMQNLVNEKQELEDRLQQFSELAENMYKEIEKLNKDLKNVRDESKRKDEEIKNKDTELSTTKASLQKAAGNMKKLKDSLGAAANDKDDEAVADEITANNESLMAVAKEGLMVAKTVCTKEEYEAFEKKDKKTQLLGLLALLKTFKAANEALLKKNKKLNSDLEELASKAKTKIAAIPPIDPKFTQFLKK